MFNSGNKQTQREESREYVRPTETSHRAQGTVIGEGTHIEGSIRVHGSLRVDGEVEGGALITTDNLTVGAKGQIKSDLAVKQAIISGTVNGKIRAKERVELLAGAHVRGDVYAQSFKIEDGVYFHGTCVMGEAAASEVESAMAPALKAAEPKVQRTPSGTTPIGPGTNATNNNATSTPAANAEKRAA